MIVRAGGTGNVRFKYIVFRGNLTVNDVITESSTIVGHANADSVMTVGAVRYSSTPAYGISPFVPGIFFLFWRNTSEWNRSQQAGFCCSRRGKYFSKFWFDQPDRIFVSNLFWNILCCATGSRNGRPVDGRKNEIRRCKAQPFAIEEPDAKTALPNGAPGYNVASGYGLIQADTAMKSFAAPKPVITKLILQDTTIKPGTQPVTITVQGDFLTGNSVVTFRGEPLPTTVLSATQAQAIIPVFRKSCHSGKNQFHFTERDRRRLLGYAVFLFTR